MRDAIDIIEEAFRQKEFGNTSQPMRPYVYVNHPHKGLLTVGMANIGGGLNALGAKIVSAYNDNPSTFKLPTVMATILLNDPQTGALLAIMEGTVPTAMRTGAASGVATKYLARKDAKTVAIFGAGVQGRTQLVAVCEVRDIEKAKVYDVYAEGAKRYCEEMSNVLGLDVVSTDNAKDAIEGSDIICTATTAKDPLFKGEWLKKGVHINAIGGHNPNLREIDDATVKNAKIVIDSKESVLKEAGGAGEIVIPLSKGVISESDIIELSEVVTGKKLGRISETEKTIFKAVGLGIEDVSIAKKIYELAQQKGVGKALTLE
jgi:ornithine cyclodeaminase/alanine dehydrogenase